MSIENKTRKTLIAEVATLLEQREIAFNYLLVHSNLYLKTTASSQVNCTKSVLQYIIDNIDYLIKQTEAERSLLPLHPVIEKQRQRIKRGARQVIASEPTYHKTADKYGMPYRKVYDIVKRTSEVTTIEWFCEYGQLGKVILNFEGIQFDLTDPEQLLTAKRTLVGWIDEKRHSKKGTRYVNSMVFIKGYYTWIDGGLNTRNKRVGKNTIDKLVNIVQWLGGKPKLTFESRNSN